MYSMYIYREERGKNIYYRLVFISLIRCVYEVFIRLISLSRGLDRAVLLRVIYCRASYKRKYWNSGACFAFFGRVLRHSVDNNTHFNSNSKNPFQIEPMAIHTNSKSSFAMCSTIDDRWQRRTVHTSTHSNCSFSTLQLSKVYVVGGQVENKCVYTYVCILSLYICAGEGKGLLVIRDADQMYTLVHIYAHVYVHIIFICVNKRAGKGSSRNVRYASHLHSYCPMRVMYVNTCTHAFSHVWTR